jgi:DNA polymerase III alpha subunit (gram-positive type)
MISLGAVAVKRDSSGELELGEKFYVELRPESELEDPGTRAIHGLDVDRLRAEGTPRGEALVMLERWVVAQTKTGTKPVFVGHNAPFDWSFVAWCYAAEGMSNPFGYKALDTKALATGELNIHWFDSNKGLIAKRLGLPNEDMGQKHRADYDAWYQAIILKGLLDHAAARRGS